MKQETINSKALCHVLLVSKQTIFFGFWNYSKCKLLVNVASP